MKIQINDMRSSVSILKLSALTFVKEEGVKAVYLLTNIIRRHQ